MNKQGRILIVEDREDWRETLSEELRDVQFRVDTAENLEQAHLFLRSGLYHVLILDIRLSDSDTSNTDGLKLLEELGKIGLTDAIQVIMLSSYGTKDRTRKAFRDHKVADFIFKTRLNHQTFVEDVRRVFSEDVGINLRMNISWSGTSNPEHAVLNLKLQLHDDVRENTRVLAGTDLQQRVTLELDDLLRRLFCNAESILVKPMPAGRSGAGVLAVRPFYHSIGGGNRVVVKFGGARKISQEYTNFKDYVEPLIGGKRCTSVQGWRRTPLLGGLIYSFLGASDQLEDFGSFYRRSDPARIKQVLDQLFLHTCSSWYANAKGIQPIDLAKDYQQLLHLTLEKVENALQKLRIVQGPTPDHLYFEAFQHWKPFRNPLGAMVGNTLCYPTYISTTHGDFNQHNLLMDQDGHIWMIDFQSTGPGHILRDIAGLDSVVRFQLLTSNEATLEERLAMERALCSISYFSQVDQLEGFFYTANPALAKAYISTVHLRSLARYMVRHNPNDDFHEYYAALLYNAFKTIRFRTLEQDQREHALLSACLLAERLEQAE
jgi:DNA-binding response OmpR family regulator